MYTNQGASYSQFYQPRRRRAYERREEVVEENQSQVSDSQSTNTLCVSTAGGLQCRFNVILMHSLYSRSSPMAVLCFAALETAGPLLS